LRQGPARFAGNARRWPARIAQRYRPAPLPGRAYLTFVLPWIIAIPTTPATTRLSTKGQMILPADLRRKYGWRPGQVLEVHDTPDGLLLKPAPLFPRTEIGAAAGMLHRPGMRTVSIEEMNEGVLQEARRRHARGRY
jgi:AbrB family looped-hinge helix DNA binding protein